MSSMTQDTGSANDSASPTAPAPDGAGQAPRRTKADTSALIRRALALVASAVRLLTTVFAAILVVHIVLSVSGANPTNGVRRFFESCADGLTLGLGDLFVSQGVDLQIILNYGVPAIVWLVIGFLVVRLVRLVSP